MDQDQAQHDEETFADRAFDDLRGEVGLLRRAIEQLVSERQKNETPDYTPTLAATATRLDEIAKFMGAVARSPAMRLTPESVAREIVAVAETARAGDREIVDRAIAGLRTSVAGINGVVERAWTADRQNRWLVGTSLAGALAGMVLWSMLPGLVARSLPEHWHAAEWMAARTLRLDTGDAGKRLVSVSQRNLSRSRAEDRGQRTKKADGEHR